MIDTQRGAHTIFDTRRSHQDDAWLASTAPETSSPQSASSANRRITADAHGSSFLADRGESTPAYLRQPLVRSLFK